ncbi:MAG: GNAT family N-acetyltransferase [Defluviitaleaceae bacterium]|nr:GNAT family N-acetyltransferase [Defluviitaleaceae bacterium]
MINNIIYTTSLDGVTAEMLDGGFFVDWPNPPSAVAHLRILQGSYFIWLAMDGNSNKVIGFINAISDGVISAYIPLLEVLPMYQGLGIGSELTARMLESLKHLYMVDVLCDEHLQKYYGKFGMYNATGSIIRNYDRQSCE